MQHPSRVHVWNGWGVWPHHSRRRAGSAGGEPHPPRQAPSAEARRRGPTHPRASCFCGREAPWKDLRQGLPPHMGACKPIFRVTRCYMRNLAVLGARGEWKRACDILHFSVHIGQQHSCTAGMGPGSNTLAAMAAAVGHPGCLGGCQYIDFKQEQDIAESLPGASNLPDLGSGLGSLVRSMLWKSA
jgi:hypothetical protein